MLKLSLVTLVVTIGGALCLSEKNPLKEFSEFMGRHNKSYSTHEDMNSAYEAFVFNAREVEELNNKASSMGSEVRFSLSEISDRYVTERTIVLPPIEGKHETNGLWDEVPNPPLPRGTVFTWQGTKKVNGVKSQGQCGSCYIFAAAAVLESVDGSGRSFSAQQALDCAIGINRCSGGFPHEVLNAMSYPKTYRGWEYESAYPAYTGNPQQCQYSVAAPMYKYSLGSTYLMSITTSTLINLIVNRGVVAVAVAVNNAFYQYSSGILTKNLCPNNQANHAVAAVGYGMDDLGLYYFILKNSWGTSWGQGGYVYVYADACSVRYYASYLG
jgi:C1A family cysteine protease